MTVSRGRNTRWLFQGQTSVDSYRTNKTRQTYKKCLSPGSELRHLHHCFLALLCFFTFLCLQFICFNFTFFPSDQVLIKFALMFLHRRRRRRLCCCCSRFLFWLTLFRVTASFISVLPSWCQSSSEQKQCQTRLGAAEASAIMNLSLLLFPAASTKQVLFCSKSFICIARPIQLGLHTSDVPSTAAFS